MKVTQAIGRSRFGMFALLVGVCAGNAAAEPLPGFWRVESSEQRGDFVTTVSADGGVVGGFRNSGLDYFGFRWTRSGSTDIPFPPNIPPVAAVYAMSGNSRFVAGQSSQGETFVPFRQVDDEFIQYLPNVAGYTRGIGLGISDDGNVVVGSSERGELSNVDMHPFRWTPQTGTVSLGFLPGFGGTGRATGVSADGSVVVGWSGFFDQRAFKWTESGGMQPLAWTNPNGFQTSYAEAISADGLTTVGFGNWENMIHAVRWTDDSAGVSLGTLPGFRTARALSVSSDGSAVVGQCSDGPQGSARAFYWSEATGMVTLDALAALHGVTLPGGFAFLDAKDISADGNTIVGTAIIPGQPTSTYFQYAMTIPAPSALAVAALMMVPMRRRRARS